MSKISQSKRILAEAFCGFIFSQLLQCATATKPQAQRIQIDASCAYDKDEILKNVELYEPSESAVAFVDKVLYYTGLTNKFEVKEAQVANAAAAVAGSKRYILLNPGFMASVNQQAGTNWASVSILAHEIGHHLNAHTLTTDGSRPDKEIDADYYSGYVLGMMGATEDQAKSAAMVLPDPLVVTTHPKKADRLAAVASGWLTAVENKGRVAEVDVSDGPNPEVETNSQNPSDTPKRRGKKKKKKIKKPPGQLVTTAIPREINQTAVEISDITTTHNQSYQENTGFVTQFQLDLLNITSEKSRLFLLFYDEHGNLIRDNNGLWASNDGYATTYLDLVFTAGELKGRRVRRPHISIFFPYKEVELDPDQHEASYAIRYCEWDATGKLRAIKESPRVKILMKTKSH